MYNECGTLARMIASGVCWDHKAIAYCLHKALPAGIVRMCLEGYLQVLLPELFFLCVPQDSEVPADSDDNVQAAADADAGSENDSEQDADGQPPAAAAAGADDPTSIRDTGSKQVAAAAADPSVAAAAAVASSSTWDWFMSRELNDTEVAALRSGRPQWHELPTAQDPTEGCWKRAK